MLQNETWRPAPGFEDKYEVSSQGRIRSIDRVVVEAGKNVHRKGRMLISKIAGAGYPIIRCGGKNISIHRLVAAAFLPKIEGKNVVNHKNSDKTDNRIENLEWCTQSENIRHAFLCGRMKPNVKPGVDNSNYKHGRSCHGAEEKDCAVCGTSFMPRIVQTVTCSLKCRAALIVKNRSAKKSSALIVTPGEGCILVDRLGK